MMLEQDEEGLVWFRRAAAALPPNPTIIAGLASELALTGRDTEARATLAQYLALESTRTRTITQWAYVPDDNAAFMNFTGGSRTDCAGWNARAVGAPVTSGLGTFRTCRDFGVESAFGGKAEVGFRVRKGCFWRKAAVHGLSELVSARRFSIVDYASTVRRRLLRSAGTLLGNTASYAHCPHAR